MMRGRVFYACIAGLCAALLSFGYYLQYARGLEPCPLCILQRLAYLAAGVIAIAALIHRPGRTGVRIYSSLVGLCTFAGSAVAARQVWLQHLPPEKVPECGPGLDYMLQVLPFLDVVRTVLKGSGECAEKAWTFLTYSIAEWSLVFFLLLTVLCILHAWRGRLGDVP